MGTTDPDGAPPATEPTSTPVRAARRPGMRALLSSIVDIAVLATLFVLWAWRVDAADPTLWTGAVLEDGRGGGNLALLGDRLSALLAVGAVMVAIAVHTPFSWHAQTLGLGVSGLQLRSRGQPAHIGLLASWAALSWCLHGIGVLGAFILLAPPLSGAESHPALALLGALLSFGWCLNEWMRARDRGAVEHVLQLHLARRDDPRGEVVAEPPSGWRPRPGTRAGLDKPVEKDLHGWRVESTGINPLQTLVGRDDVGGMHEPPPLPDHVETVGYAEPSPDPDGQTRGDPEADAWVERLRQRGLGGEHERS